MAIANLDWESLFQEAVGYLCDLIRFKTVNPPGNEKPAAQYLADILAKNSIDCQMLEAAPSRTNLIARLKGTGEKPPILLDGHLDVVSAEPESDWKYPPFSGKVAEGCIWGRGALDMKQTVIMNLMALLVLKRAGGRPKRDLIFAAVADEEEGSKLGAQFLVENHPDLVRAEYGLGEIGGFCLEMEGKRFYPVEVAERGLCWFRLRAKGDSGHGSIPAPESAVIRLAAAVEKLGKKKLPYHLTAPAKEFIAILADNLGGIKGRVLKLLLNETLADFVIDRVLPDKKLARTFWAALHNTANPTVLSGGEKTNVIPKEATVEVDGRLLPGQTPDSLLAEVREIIGEDLAVELIHCMQPAVQDVDDPVLKIFEKRIKAHDPRAIVLPYMVPGFTDGSNYARLGIKYFGFSPLKLKPGESFQELFHNKDERIPLEGYKFGLRVHIETIWEMVTEF